MKFKTNALPIIKDILIIISGGIVYAVGFSVFIAPANLTPGGVTGIADAVNHIFPAVPTGLTIILLNIPLLAAALFSFGKMFIFKTFLGTIVSGLFVDICENYCPKYLGDKFLTGIAGGVIMGAGIAFLIIRGATTGGTDILAKLISAKRPHIPLGRIILALDAAVLTFAAFVYKDFEALLYSIVSIFIQTRVIDALVYGADKGKLVLIITANGRRVAREIMKHSKRGITEIPVNGGYTGKARTMLLCAVRRHEITGVVSAVKRTDSTAFLIVSEAGEILGQGFKDM